MQTRPTRATWSTVLLARRNIAIASPSEGEGPRAKRKALLLTLEGPRKIRDLTTQHVAIRKERIDVWGIKQAETLNTINMEASSNKDRLAIFRNCLNSCAWVLPEPSAMLLVKESPAARNCSA